MAARHRHRGGGLARSGHHDAAASLGSGLLEAAPRFDFRLPEARELVIDPLGPAVAGAVSASGLRLARQELTVSVSREGAVSADTRADVVIRRSPGIRPGRQDAPTT